MLTADCVADFERIEPAGADGQSVPIPPECGVVFLFSYRWRKGLYYDFGPFHPDGAPRSIDLARLFAHLYARLVFQEMYSISESQWQHLLDWGWFPFIGLSHNDRQQLLHFAGQDAVPHAALAAMCHRYLAHLEDRLDVWRRNDMLASHMEFLTRARERLAAGDFLSCLSLLIPRIEGVLRTLFVEENPGLPASQGTMVSNLVENQYAHSLLLPGRFEEYLRRVYFRAFDQHAGDLSLSRHSHGHGVSQAADYDFERAVVGFLTLDQIYYYLTD